MADMHLNIWTLKLESKNQHGFAGMKTRIQAA